MRLDPTPDKGRALGRVAERQGRDIRKASTDASESAEDSPESAPA